MTDWNESIAYKPGDTVRDWVIGPKGIKRLWAWILYYVKYRPRPLSKDGEWVTYECVREHKQ